jgi:hypothetical protein
MIITINFFHLDTPFSYRNGKNNEYLEVKLLVSIPEQREKHVNPLLEATHAIDISVLSTTLRFCLSAIALEARVPSSFESA